MTHPEQICDETVSVIDIDSFSFYYGRPPDQNFDSEKQSLPAVFLDTPIVSQDSIKQTNVIYANTLIKLFFAYKMDFDGDSMKPESKANKQKAWDAARQFLLRIRQRDDVWDITNITRTDVDRVFDICLGGVLLECTLQIIDNNATCLS